MRSVICPVVLVVVMIAIPLCTGIVCGEGESSTRPTSEQKNNTSPVALEVAVIADAKQPTLLLTVTNISKESVRIPEFMEEGNALRIIEPGGTGGEAFAMHPEPIKKFTLRPGESKSWEYDAGWHMVRAGKYTFSWRIQEWTTPAVTFIRKADAPTSAKPSHTSLNESGDTI